MRKLFKGGNYSRKYGILFILFFTNYVYRDSHGYQLGTGPLPITISQLEEKPAIDSQQSTTKCHICDTNFKDLDTLFLHKSLHVNPKVIY